MSSYRLINDDFLDPPKSIFWKIRHLFATLIPVFLIFVLLIFLVQIYRDSDMVILSWDESKKLFYHNFNSAFTSDDAHEKAARNIQYTQDYIGSYERRNRERANDLDILIIGFKMYQYRFKQLPVTKDPERIKAGSRIYRELKTVLSHVPTDPLPVGENSDYLFDCRDRYHYKIIMYFEEIGGDAQHKRSERDYSNY